MSLRPPPISGVERYVDEQGRLTWEGQRLLQSIVTLIGDPGANTNTIIERLEALEP